MAVLQLIRGGDTGIRYLLDEEQNVLGRHPSCDIILQSGVVSRRHAQILESHGTFYIEDLRSRNGTFVNEEMISGRHELQEGDEIRLCDVVLVFLFTSSAVVPTSRKVSPDDVANTIDVSQSDVFRLTGSLEESQIYRRENLDFSGDSDFDSSTSIRKVSSFHAEGSLIDPRVKLRAILELTQALGRELKIEKVLPKMLTTLFNIFPQAEQGFVLLKDAETSRLKVKASRSRGGQKVDNVAVSMTVVRHALQTREAILSKNVSDDSRFKQNTALSKMHIRSIMCVPMVTPEDKGIGVIQIVTRDERNAFEEDDLDLLVSLASQASMAVENARMHEEDLVRRELERDLDFATQVQLGFLPKSRPKIEGYSFSDYYEAALSVGGDYFDYIMLPNGRVALAIGDVAGKGIPAALLMARLYSSTRYQLLTQSSIAEAVSGLNEEISSSGLGHRFITFLIMVLDPKTHTFELVNAGHLTPLLRRADRTIEGLGASTSSLPLGIVPDLQYESSTHTLEPGETIIAFTDGVTEAMNSHKEIFGPKRLAELYATLPDDIQQIVDGIVAKTEEFEDGINARDDTCLIGVCRSRQ